MMHNQRNTLTHSFILKNSDQYGRIQLAYYLVNTSKKENPEIFKTVYASKKRVIMGFDLGARLKHVRSYHPDKPSNISNKKQSP